MSLQLPKSLFHARTKRLWRPGILESLFQPPNLFFFRELMARHLDSQKIPEPRGLSDFQCSRNRRRPRSPVIVTRPRPGHLLERIVHGVETGFPADNQLQLIEERVPAILSSRENSFPT